MKKADPTRVLLVDDDPDFRKVMASELARRGYEVDTAECGVEALEKAEGGRAQVVLLDLRLPDMDGIEVLQQLRARIPTLGVIVLTGHGTIDTAIQAIRLGAYDYLEKPCPIEKLELAVQKTLEHQQLLQRQRVLEDGYAAPNLASGLVGSSAAFLKLLADVTRIACADATTLVLGETGVGKEVIATLLHAQSPRSEAPFVVVDCAALHEDLLQSELFGHEKGAFTGAARRKHGLFEVAHGGTIFLDEIGEMSPETQSSLLRVLEANRFRRLGGTEEISVDVRVVAATNRNLREAITRGHFREDLFYRLATLRVNIPPLRERQEDIKLLVDHFAGRFNTRFSRTVKIGGEAMGALLAHHWPGNVRELIHVVEQAVVLCQGDTIEMQDLPRSVRGAAESGSALRQSPATLHEVERRHIQSIVNHVHGNRAEAARILGISERNLYRLLKRYNQESDTQQP